MNSISCNEHVSSYGTDSDDKEQDASLQTKLGLAPGVYTFMYDYPLDNGAYFTHDLTPDTTAHDILLLAQADYKRIYDEEDAAVGHPGNIPGMLNRSTSKGPYGIWGHDMSDLYFESINIDENLKQVEFDIGS